MIFFLLHKDLDKTSLTNSLQALVSHQKKKNDDAIIDEKEEKEEEEENEEEESKKSGLLMSYNKATCMMARDTHDMKFMPLKRKANYEHDLKRAVDLTHALFKESEAEMEKEGETEEMAVEGGGEGGGGGGGGGGSVVVEEEMGEEDIDQAADMFIQRFKKQMLLQKQRSIERQQWLLLSNS